MYDNYNVTTCPIKIITTYPMHGGIFARNTCPPKPLAHKAVLIPVLSSGIYFTFLLCQFPVVAGYFWRKVNFRKCKKFTRRGKNLLLFVAITFSYAVYHLQILHAALG